MTKKQQASKKGKKGKTPKPPLDDFPVVGMGASAGGLEAFEAFFKNMPAGTGIAFIIVTHLDPSHSSMMGELIARFTEMPVIEAQDEMPVKPDHVYIIPPNKDLAILNGALQLMTFEEPRGLRMPIDFFLRSLADDVGGRAVCVILSGNGSDGSAGLQAIHEVGGMSMVQEVSTAQYSGMPLSAIGTGLADFVVPVEAMPGQLLAYVKQGLAGKRQGKPAIVRKTQSSLQKILVLLRSQTGHDFSHYKKSTLYRRIERRMGLHDIGDMATYAKYLRDNQAEAQALFKELLIVVTSFFRDGEAFEVLQKKALPKLLGDRPDGDPIRVWVPGCATGEEVYSVAILLKEYMLEHGRDFPVQLFGTDMDDDAIKKARAGVFPENIVNDVSSERLERFFIHEDGSYRVKKEVREMAVFALHNVIKDAPFTRLDLLCCRNLLIYLENEIQQNLLPLFHYSLKQDAVLFLGASESIGRFVDLFKPLDSKWKIYIRREAVAAQQIHDFGMLFGARTPDVSAIAPRDPVKAQASSAEIVQQQLLDSYAPPSLLINKNGDIIFIHGRTGKYLEPAAGQATLNILEMARPGLQFELRSAISIAATRKEEVHYQGLSVDTGAGTHSVELTVKPFSEPESMQDYLLVVLEDAGKKKPGRSGKQAAPAPGRDQQIESLETELKYTRESQQAVIEELQSTNEELMSSNEELQSTNEELQSTNEELETSQEELQSMNEELITVNSELQAKHELLSRAENDMKNLLDSTEIGTIFLDGSMNVARFTPRVTDIINLIPSDIGRPLEHIVMNIDYNGIIDDVREVYRASITKEVEVRTKAGVWYLARLTPYRTKDDVTAGVVITFTDVSDTKLAAEAILNLETAARKYAEGIVETVPLPLLVLDQELSIVSANKEFYDFFHIDKSATQGTGIYRLDGGLWDMPELRTILEKVLPERENFEGFVIEHELPGIGHQRLILNGRKISYMDIPPLILLSIQEESAVDG